MKVRVALQDCSLAYIFYDTSLFRWRFRVDSDESCLNAEVKWEKLTYGNGEGQVNCDYRLNQWKTEPIGW
ncbi:hypothetical protein STEG23_037871 [Scotinomys teguina]